VPRVRQRTSLGAAYHWMRGRHEPFLCRRAPLVAVTGEVPGPYCRALGHKWGLSERALDDYRARLPGAA
jgi:hypothetical protein